jgi:TfoX/Sxy family transcriptional regulator of competence genes
VRAVLPLTALQSRVSASKETLYLKEDAQSSVVFTEAGGEPSRYAAKDGRSTTMDCWTVPESALESTAEMLPWGREALAAAIRQRKPQRPAVSMSRSKASESA